MTELFGFQAGQRLAQKDQLEQQLAQLSLEQGQQQLQRGKVLAEKDQVDLDNAKITQNRQLEFLKALKEYDGSGMAGEVKQDGPDLPSRLDKLAELSMQSGLLEQAADYSAKASSIRNNNSLIKSRENEQQQRELTFAAGVLDKVVDEKGWKEANMLYSVEFGKESPFAGMDYSPELVQRIKDSVTTERQKSLIEAAEAKAKMAGDELEKIKSQTRLNAAKTKITETREKNLSKAGGKETLPKAADLKAITDLIAKEYGGAAPAEDARVLARPIAERMVQLKNENGLSQSEAAAMAFKEAQDAGDLGGLKERRKSFGSKENPLPAPKDAKQYKKNMYYIVPAGEHAGKTVLYTGKGNKPFELVE